MFKSTGPLHDSCLSTCLCHPTS